MNDYINILLCILFIIISYLIGSIPFALILGKIFKNIDIREHGSKNIGSTNAIRVLGKKVGLIVFALDVFKGVFVMIIVKFIFEQFTSFQSPINIIYYGLFAIFGHTYSIYLKFKGGKAVATSLGVVCFVSPIAAIGCVIMFLLTLYITGYAAIASTVATLTVGTIGWILFFLGLDPNTYYIVGKTSIDAATIYTVMGLFIFYKHRQNYIRIFNGIESNFKHKNKNK